MHQLLIQKDRVGKTSHKWSITECSCKFIWKDWEKYHYWNIFGGKTVLASYVGECFYYLPDEHHHITVTSPVYLQGDHEEPDMIIVFMPQISQ